MLTHLSVVYGVDTTSYGECAYYPYTPYEADTTYLYAYSDTDTNAYAVYDDTSIV